MILVPLALALLAAVLAAATVSLLARRRQREAEQQEPVHPVPPIAERRRVLLRLVRRLVQRRRDTSRDTSWAGATEHWSPAAEIGDQDLTAELVTPAEQRAADHAALDPLGDATREFGDAVWQAIDHFLRDDPAAALRVRSGADQTAEWTAAEVADLRAALDDDELAAWMDQLETVRPVGGAR
jgi:hypothetical protein